MAQVQRAEIDSNTSLQPVRWDKLRMNALLLLVTIIWGGTFLVIQHTVRLSGPFTFLMLRFAFALLTLVLLFHRRVLHLRRSELLAGAFIGLFLFIGFALQTVGLQYTTTSKAAFITGLYVPLVPLLSVFLLRQRPTAGALAGVGLSFIGMTLLSVDERFNLDVGPGEILMVGCACGVALHVVNVSRFAPHSDAVNLTIVQIGMVFLLSLAAIPVAGEPFVLPPLAVWGSTLFMGVVATALCLSVVNRVQQYMSSTQAVLVYALEPVWAGVFGFLVGERLGVAALAGCGFILLGIVTSQARLPAAIKTIRKKQAWR